MKTIIMKRSNNHTQTRAMTSRSSRNSRRALPCGTKVYVIRPAHNSRKMTEKDNQYDRTGIIAKQGTCENGGWYEIIMDDNKNRVEHYRRTSLQLFYDPNTSHQKQPERQTLPSLNIEEEEEEQNSHEDDNSDDIELYVETTPIASSSRSRYSSTFSSQSSDCKSKKVLGLLKPVPSIKCIRRKCMVPMRAISPSI